MKTEKIGYYALKAGNTLEFLASGITAAAAIYSATQREYELGGVLAFVSLYIGTEAYGHRQDIEIMKYRNKVRKSWQPVDEAIKRNKDAFDTLLGKTSKAP